MLITQAKKTQGFAPKHQQWRSSPCSTCFPARAVIVVFNLSHTNKYKMKSQSRIDG